MFEMVEQLQACVWKDILERNSGTEVEFLRYLVILHTPWTGGYPTIWHIDIYLGILYVCSFYQNVKGNGASHIVIYENGLESAVGNGHRHFAGYCGPYWEGIAGVDVKVVNQVTFFQAVIWPRHYWKISSPSDEIKEAKCASRALN